VSRLLSIALLLGFLLPAWGADTGFVVSRPKEAMMQDDTYVLDLQIDYEFSDAVLEALDNGVPLTLVVRAQVRRKGAWIWESNLADLRRLYLIRYQPLSEIYQVAGLPNGERRHFVSRSAAITALGEINGLPLIARDRLAPDESYLVRVKVELDIEALPLPLRPTAYLSPSWSLSSDWSEWALQPQSEGQTLP
jgi:hypothetical protein